MDTLMCEEKDFIFDPSRNWKANVEIEELE